MSEAGWMVDGRFRIGKPLGRGEGETYRAVDTADGGRPVAVTLIRLDARGAAVGAQIADVLAALHRVGILHHNLKPTNVMLLPSGRVKVLGLGIALRFGARTGRRVTSTGRLSSTVRYIHPTQLTGRPATEQYDLYGLGRVLYELLCGTPPFAEDGTEVDPEPKALRDDVPEALDTLVTALLRDSPNEGPRSAAEVADALAAIARDAPAERLPTEHHPTLGAPAEFLPTPQPTPAQQDVDVLSPREDLVEEYRNDLDADSTKTADQSIHRQQLDAIDHGAIGRSHVLATGAVSGRRLETTPSSEDAPAQRRRDVAGFATAFFGQEIGPHRVVGETPHPVAPPLLDPCDEDLIRPHVHAIRLAAAGSSLGTSIAGIIDTRELDAEELRPDAPLPMMEHLKEDAANPRPLQHTLLEPLAPDPEGTAWWELLRNKGGDHGRIAAEFHPYRYPAGEALLPGYEYHAHPPAPDDDGAA